jgi:hypothetical protein
MQILRLKLRIVLKLRRISEQDCSSRAHRKSPFPTFQGDNFSAFEISGVNIDTITFLRLDEDLILRETQIMIGWARVTVKPSDKNKSLML